MRRRSDLAKWLVAALTVMSSVAGAADVKVGHYEAVEVFRELALNGAEGFAPYGDGFLVLDRFNHRLLRLDASGAVVRQIGRIGQAPGELHFPWAYAVGREKVLIASNSTTFSVHGFSPDGEFIDSFRQGTSPADVDAYSSFTIAVDSAGRVYLNQPRLGRLLTRYSDGGEELGGLGELVEPERVFPDCDRHALCGDRRFRFRLNRVLAAATPGDSLAVAFTAAPIVRKYSSGGELGFEVRLGGDWVEELVGVSMKGREKWGEYVAFNLATDGVNALAVVTSLAVDARTGLIYCLVGGKEIHVLSPDGESLGMFRQGGDDRSFASLSVHDGRAYLANMRHLYVASLPEL